MKHLLSFVLTLFCTSALLAQVPNSFNYQSIVRDGFGALVGSQQLGVKVSIVKDSLGGNVQYSETHSPTTNSNGLFSIQIGEGNATTGVFDSIGWESGGLYYQVEVDMQGGTNYTLNSFQPFTSVAYAKVAERALNVEDADADPTNELQQISLSGDTLSLSNGGSVVLNHGDNDFGGISEMLSLTGSVSGTISAVVTAGTPFSAITVPSGKVYNVRYVNLAKSGQPHNMGLRINGHTIWDNTSNNGECNIWLKEGDVLSHYYGDWAGYQGSFSDSWFISVMVYDSVSLRPIQTLTGSVSGTISAVVTAGTPFSAITVPSGKVYNVRYVNLAKSGQPHNMGLRINGHTIWDNTSNNGECNIWLKEGDVLSHYYGDWAGYQGSFSDSWFISIQEFDK